MNLILCAMKINKTILWSLLALVVELRVKMVIAVGALGIGDCLGAWRDGYMQNYSWIPFGLLWLTALVLRDYWFAIHFLT